jgi:phytanoyl-CoA hydroxylase
MQLRDIENLDRGSYIQRYEPLRDEFQRNGCVLISGFLTSPEVRSLRVNLDRFIAGVAPGLRDGSAIRVDGQLRALENLLVDAYFADIASSPKFLGLGDALLGLPVAPGLSDELNGPFGGQVYIDMPPGAKVSTPPHQDGRYHNLMPPESLNVWVALDDTSIDNGGMRYVRGSHRSGLRPHGTDGQQPGFSMKISDFDEADVAKEVSFVMRPGDAVAHHGHTIHRSLGNSTGRRRPAFCMFMRWEGCERDAEGHAWYMRILDAHFEHYQLKDRAQGMTDLSLQQSGSAREKGG